MPEAASRSDCSEACGRRTGATGVRSKCSRHAVCCRRGVLAVAPPSLPPLLALLLGCRSALPKLPAKCVAADDGAGEAAAAAVASRGPSSRQRRPDGGSRSAMGVPTDWLTQAGACAGAAAMADQAVIRRGRCGGKVVLAACFPLI